MSLVPKRYTITAALPYTNGPVHIGHLAGVYVPADIYARYLRLKGRDVAFICGSDEHGVAISIKAKKEGKTPQEIIDKYDKVIREAFGEFGITFDNYSRTSRAIHHETAAEFFKNLNVELPDKPSPYIAYELSFIDFNVFIDYRNFNVANPTSAKIIAIIQNLITIVDSGQPFFSK